MAAILHLALALGVVPVLTLPARADEAAAWEALRAGGVVAILRHAAAPGTGDPPGFRLEDCTTQRNLSERGRAQARQIGAAFAERQVQVARVLSSGWCRALDTARLAFGRAEAFPPLNSFFRDRSDEAQQSAAVRRLVQGWRGQSGVLALVTHQVNITALTGVFPQEGEIVVLRPSRDDGFALVGRIPALRP